MVSGLIKYALDGGSTSSLIGAITFVSLNQFEIDQSLSAVIGASMVIFTRFIPIYFDLHLPKFNNSKNRK
jgi:uncharacterized membrane protein YeiH